MVRKVSQFDEVAKLIKRNNTYTEKHKIEEEEEKIKREPVGNYQSSSNSDRWDKFHKNLKLERLTYNIEKSDNRNAEMKLLKDNMEDVEDAIEENEQEIIRINGFKKVFLEGASAFHKRKQTLKNNCKDETSQLEALLKDIKLQLSIYHSINHSGRKTPFNPDNLVRKVSEFDEVAKLIKRNNTYTDRDKIKEEKEELNSEPVGNYQSPSNSDRWDRLYKKLKLKRLTYNIEKSDNRHEEMNLLKDNIEDVKDAIEENQQEIIRLERASPLHNRKQKEKSNYKHETSQLEALLKDIKLQLSIYRSIFSNLSGGVMVAHGRRRSRRSASNGGLRKKTRRARRTA